MSRYKAWQQARAESHMYWLAAQWIISTWDEEVNAWREGPPLNYHYARVSLRDWRIERAASLAKVSVADMDASSWHR